MYRGAMESIAGRDLRENKKSMWLIFKFCYIQFYLKKLIVVIYNHVIKEGYYVNYKSLHSINI